MLVIKQLKKLLTHSNCKDKKILTILKVILWKFNQLTFKKPIISPFSDSTKLVCYPDSSYGGYVFFARYPEVEEMDFIKSIVSDSDTIIDVGANIGAITVLAASKALKGHVHAFEPTPELIPRIHENVALNNLSERVTINQLAVGDENGTIQFTQGSHSEVNKIYKRESGDNTKTLDVRSITLDTYAKNTKIRHIHLLKVDVEGAELLVFRGAKSILRSTDVIVFEVNKNCTQFGYTADELVDHIRTKGFFVFALTSVKLVLINQLGSINQTINLVAVKKTPQAVSKITHYL